MNAHPFPPEFVSVDASKNLNRDAATSGIWTATIRNMATIMGHGKQDT